MWVRDGALVWHRIDQERAQDIAARMEVGEDYDDARRATRRTA